MKSKDNLNLESLYCEILNRNNHILEEMFTIGTPHIQGNFYFIAYRSKLWIINEKISETDLFIFSDMEKELGISIDGSIDNSEELFAKIRDNKKTTYQLLFGYFDKKLDEMIIENTYFDELKDHNISTLVSKVSKLLDPSNIRYRKYGDFKTRDNIFYHGTSAYYLKSILKKGLDHNTANSNHGDDVKKLTNGKTFLTTNYNYAREHAREVGNKTKSNGIVLEIKLNFKDMLQPDYDVWRNYSNPKRAMQLSKEMGVYAYPKLITRMNIPNIYILNIPEDIKVSYFGYDDWLIKKDGDVNSFIEAYKVG